MHYTVITPMCYLVDILQFGYDEFQSSFGITHTSYGDREGRTEEGGQREEEGGGREGEGGGRRRWRGREGGERGGREEGGGGRREGRKEGGREGGGSNLRHIYKHCTHNTYLKGIPSLHIFYSAHKLAEPEKVEKNL